MVDHADADQLPCRDELSGSRDICITRVGDIGRMIVHEYHCDCRIFEGWTEYLARMDDISIYCADRYDLIVHYLVLRIEIYAAQVLL